MKSGWPTSVSHPKHARSWWCHGDDEDPPRVLVIYVLLTSEDRGSQYEVKMPRLPFLRLEGVANVQGIASLPQRRLERRLGVLPKAVMDQIKDALRFALDL